LPISTRVRGGVAAALSQLKPALRNAVRLRDVEIDGEVVRIPGDFPHGLALLAGVAPEPGQPPIYDSDGRLPSHLPPGRGE
jgi:hypothetical protein